MERVLGSRIEWMRVPAVKSVLKARQRRILAAILAAVPEIADEASGGLAAAPDAPSFDGPSPAVILDGASSDGLPAESVAPLPLSADESPVVAAVSSEAGPAAGAVPGEAARPAIALSRLSRLLIERLGPEGAVEALVTTTYGELLDPGRYAPVTELPDPATWEAGEGRRKGRMLGPPGRAEGGRLKHGGNRVSFGRRHREEGHGGEALGIETRLSRVYVGVGRRHGATARDVAGILMRAGGVPGRLVESIEMKDFCAFASLPEDAAKRAFVFSRNTPNDPAIKPAAPERHNAN
jgi:ATP-dependent RNA helicase DeaD